MQLLPKCVIRQRIFTLDNYSKYSGMMLSLALYIIKGFGISRLSEYEVQPISFICDSIDSDLVQPGTRRTSSKCNCSDGCFSCIRPNC